jgi:hypothetical protein
LRGRCTCDRWRRRRVTWLWCALHRRQRRGRAGRRAGVTAAAAATGCRQCAERGTKVTSEDPRGVVFANSHPTRPVVCCPRSYRCWTSSTDRRAGQRRMTTSSGGEPSPATPLSLALEPETGGFASPPRGGFASCNASSNRPTATTNKRLPQKKQRVAAGRQPTLVPGGAVSHITNRSAAESGSIRPHVSRFAASARQRGKQGKHGASDHRRCMCRNW